MAEAEAEAEAETEAEARVRAGDKERVLCSAVAHSAANSVLYMYVYG